jgi:hypothetical protein
VNQLIEQYQYTTTQKYNFSHTVQDLRLPQHFIQLSLQTLKNIKNSRLFQPYAPTQLANPTAQTREETTHLFTGSSQPKLKPILLKPIKDETPIIAVDVSSMKIGETDVGILCAIRAAIVWKQKRQYRYLRLGPFPFHITEENKKEVYHLFRQYSFLEQPTLDYTSTLSLIHAPTRLGALLERWLQMSIIAQTRNSLILWDGSLTAGTQDAPVAVMSQLLKTARNRFNTVLAFTKMTRLRLLGHRLTDYVHRCTPPCLLEIDGYPMALSNAIRLLGNLYVAKLSEGNCAFRLDIDRKLPQEKAVEAAQRLIGNDLLLQSYPETLRLAHIYSTFTANEVIGIKRFLAQTHRLKIVARPNVRRLLFGPFGKGPES